MSEYQYYEFLAVDRPLTVTEQAEVRELSTRARITATSFTNEYHWGDFRGDASHLMQRYYDACTWRGYRPTECGSAMRTPSTPTTRAYRSRRSLKASNR
jgi:hypothetical protein